MAKKVEFNSLIGQAIAGNGRLAGGTTLLEKYPERYRNIFTDWVDLLIAEAKIKQIKGVEQMARYIIKLEDYYLEWSTITDSPVTFGMPLEWFKEYYRDEYGRSSMAELYQRLERVEKNGTSSHTGITVKELVAGNRAGPNETSLTIMEIIKAYCKREPIKDGWMVPVIEIE